MTRFLTALTAGLLLAGGAAAADAKKITIRWHGQSFFEIISSAGTRIVIDPHAIPQFGRQVVKADLVLTSHLHNDHTRVEEAVENYKEAKRYDGIVGQDNIRGEWKLMTDVAFKDVKLTSLASYHDAEKGLKRGKNTIWIIEVDKLRIVHLGDLGHPLNETTLTKLGKVDVLMIPIGGVYTLNGSDAKEVVKQIKPTRYILPMHYGTEVYDDLLPATEFLDEQKPEIIQKLRTNELVIEPDGKPPTEPLIVLLRWEKPEKP